MRNNCFELGRARKIGSGTYISTTSKTRQAKDQTSKQRTSDSYIFPGFDL